MLRKLNNLKLTKPHLEIKVANHRLMEITKDIF